MKKVLIGIYSAVCVLLSFFGFYLMIQNLGRDTTWTIVFAIMFAVGVLGILLYALVIFLKRRKASKESSPKEEDE